MFRIGIIGTENSHANGFAEFMNKPDGNGNYRYDDCRITMCWGHYPESNKALAEQYGIEKIADNIEEMVNNVDAVMITARDGKFHAEFAKPFIKAGIPAFIDKPFTVDIQEAKEVIALAKAKKVPLCGGSSLKFAEQVALLRDRVKASNCKIFGGTVVAPVNMENEYSGFYFYASHLTEMTLEIFGFNPKSISAVRHNGGVTATVNYEDFSVTNHFNNGVYYYSASVYFESGEEHYEVSLDNVAKLECDDFVEMLRSGKMSQTYEELIVPVYYMNAVKKAYETGKTIEVLF